MAGAGEKGADDHGAVLRYGLKETDASPFPQDVTLGIEMLDETVIPVAEDVADCPECPECPEACVPLFDHVKIVVAGLTGLEWTCSSAVINLDAGGGDEVNFDYRLGGFLSTDNPFALYIFPIMQRCGHRTRFVATQGTADWTSAQFGDDLSDPYSDYMRLSWTTSSDVVTSRTGTVRVQIDLTDAAPGSETWTDFGPLINIIDFSP